MLNIAIIIAAAVLLGLLLYFEHARDVHRVLPVKTALSCLFILTALLQPHPLPRYDWPIMIGLFLCLGGDVFLALQHEKAFLLGLVSFLLGHVCYVVAFFQIGTLNIWFWGGTAGCVILGVVIYRWLYPHLGNMKLPVLMYVLVISAMVAGAFASFGTARHLMPGRLLVLSGALFFYFSDIFVARDRFLQNAFLNRLIGLPLYYLGQFLLAFSVGFFVN
jgi:uncharacterized membrane protein YhhN